MIWMSRMLVLLCLVAFHVTPASADDGAFEGDGANVYPIKNSDIQMVSETILMQFDEEKLRWSVDVTMNFRNHGAATTVQMGFPFRDPYSPEDYDEMGKNTGPEYDFRSFVNGTVVKTKTRQGTLNPELPKDLFEKVMTFPVHFRAGEKKTTRHTYVIGGESSSTGEWVVSYILRTGALWRGVIEDCEVRVEMPQRSAERYYIVSPKEHGAVLENGILKLSWHFKNLEPAFDIKLESMPTELVAYPTEKLMEWLKTTGMYRKPRYLRYFKNRTYARYGRKFQNPYFMSQFMSLPAQNGKTHFSPALMAPVDKEFIKFMEFLEKEATTTR